MTKKEYEFNYNKLQLTGKDAISRLYIKSLEAKIAELEAPKTCEGCRHRNHLADETEPCNAALLKLGMEITMNQRTINERDEV